MNKPQRCLLHLNCIGRKMVRGQDWQWHWAHILREFGLGEYSDAGERQTSSWNQKHVVSRQSHTLA